MIHNFMCLVEKNGGDCKNTISLLLEDKAMWAENVLLLQEDKKRGRARVIAALVITMILAAVFHSIYRSMPERYSIVNSIVTQSVTACYLILNIFIFQKPIGNWQGAGWPESISVTVKRHVITGKLLRLIIPEKYIENIYFMHCHLQQRQYTVSFISIF